MFFYLWPLCLSVKVLVFLKYFLFLAHILILKIWDSLLTHVTVFLFAAACLEWFWRRLEVLPGGAFDYSVFWAWGLPFSPICQKLLLVPTVPPWAFKLTGTVREKLLSSDWSGGGEWRVSVGRKDLPGCSIRSRCDPITLKARQLPVRASPHLEHTQLCFDFSWLSSCGLSFGLLFTPSNQPHLPSVFWESATFLAYW